MKLLIAVPSKARADMICQNTLAYLPLVGFDYRVFVEPQDYAAYRNHLEASALIELDDNGRGLGYAKMFMAKYASAQGYDVVFKMDDDVRFWSPGHGTAQQNRAETPNTLRKAINACLDLMERRPQVKAVGFNYLQFMHNPGEHEFEYFQRLQTAYLCRLDSFVGREDISTFEDFHTALSIWVNGSITARYLHAGMQISAAVGTTRGGLQLFDRVAMAQREIQILKRLYPPLKLRVTDTPWKYEPDLAAAVREIKKQHGWKHNTNP